MYKVEFIKRKLNTFIFDKKGDGNSVSQTVWILIAVVVGGLFLSILYKYFGSDLLPNVQNKINGLLNYSGT